MTPGLVSIIITTYYRNDRLPEAIQSAKNQTYSPVELIVVDGSGEAYASSVIENHEDVKYVPLDNDPGAHTARKIGFEHSTGEYIQFLDDDDKLRPEKIDKQVNIFERRAEVGVVYSGKEWETGETVLPNPEVRGDVVEYALKFSMNPCLTSTMLIRRSVLEEAPFSDDFIGAGELALKIELAKRTHFEYVDEPLVVAGIPESTLGTSWSAIEGRKKILNEYKKLYERFDPSVRRTALAETYNKEGRRRLDDKLWSARAIFAFAIAVYYDPQHRLLYWSELVSSILGRPGRKLARKVRRSIVDN